MKHSLSLALPLAFPLALPLGALLSIALIWQAAAQDLEEPAEPPEAAVNDPQQSDAQGSGEAEEAALHEACAAAPGSKQAVPADEREGQQAAADTDDMRAALSDMERQLQAAVSQQNIDRAFACSLLAFHRGLAAMAGVHAEHGEEQRLKEAVQQFLTDIEDERQQLIQWLDRHQQQ